VIVPIDFIPQPPHLLFDSAVCCLHSLRRQGRNGDGPFFPTATQLWIVKRNNEAPFVSWGGAMKDRQLFWENPGRIR